jgi:hypothetical protein
MSLTPETITREQASILLYVESCAVEYGGLLEGVRINATDLRALVSLTEAGYLTFGRIPGKLLGSFQRGVTHWCDLTDAGWALAHQMRRARAARSHATRGRIDLYIAEQADDAETTHA